MALTSGTKLGPYEIQSPLGAGGMGEVYRARDPRLERTVAIKVLPTHLNANPELRARFEREAKAISGLQHPNICVLYDVGSQGDIDFLVMEYLEGETLYARLARKPVAASFLPISRFTPASSRPPDLIFSRSPTALPPYPLTASRLHSW
jgi:eukaryotic-like serine/threonine-protein kinase